jgi:glucose/mannose-6-phosphate isomerase
MEIKPVILNFHLQFKKGIDSAENIKINGDFDNVVVCGMGGSAWPAEMIKDWLNPNFPLYVNKTYELPAQINKKSLIIISSYSGNTEETLSCYEKAKNLRLGMVGITTGGELEKLCKKDKIPLVLNPNDVPAPRLGCGYTFGSIVKILSNAGLIEDKSKEIITAAEKVGNKSREEKGRKLAEKIFGKIPVIYSTDRLKTLAYIWKIKFNETSKIPSFCNYFPELNHNELSAYTKIKDNLAVIILRDDEEISQIQKRILLTSEIIKSKNIPVELINLEGDNLVEKILGSISLADWTSYYLALKNEVDPLSIELQDNLKKNLRNKND